MSTYINYDNFLFVGLGNKVCIKNLSNLCEAYDGWEVIERECSNPVVETEYYNIHDDFSMDLYYFFLSNHQLFVRFKDGKKQIITIKDG